MGCLEIFIRWWHRHRERRAARRLSNWNPPVVDSFYPFHEPPPGHRRNPFHRFRL